MKNSLLIISMAINLVLAGMSFAATHDKLNNNNTLQHAQPNEIFGSLDNYADRDTLETLMQKLKDPDPFVRVEGVQSLGEIYREQSLESVCGSLKDENLYVRAYAAEAVGKIGRIDISLALLSLLTALDDPSPYVRAMTLAALGEFQDKRAVASVRECLHDEDEDVRKMAVWALKNIENH